MTQVDFSSAFVTKITYRAAGLLRVCENASVYVSSFRVAHEAFKPNWYSFQPFHIASMHPNPPWKPPDNRNTSYLTTDKSYTYWKLPTNVFLVDFSLDLGLQNTENVEDIDGYKFMVPACVQSRHTNFCSSGVCQNVNETFHSCSIMQCGLNAYQCILFDWKYVELMLAWYMRLTDFSIVMRIGENDQVVHIWELLTWTFQRTTWLGKESCISQIYSHLPHMRIVWNGLAMNGNSEAALALFSQMKRYKDVSPNEVIFIGVLTACSHGGFVDRGYFYLKEMTQCYDLHPCIGHYGCVVDLLGRANLLDEALKFIDNLPVQPDAVMRRSLLFACRSHGNIELAEYAAAQVRKLNPTTCGSPVLLSNVYASALRWGDVKKVRENMAQLVMHEQPGCSSIEINGVLHAFLVKVHPEVKYVVNTNKGIIITMSTPTSRITFQNDNHTLHFLLHSKVNLLGNLMKGKKSHDSFVNDGLLMWGATEKMVKTYFNYDHDPSIVLIDKELQAWYFQAVITSHTIYKDAGWWPLLVSFSNNIFMFSVPRPLTCFEPNLLEWKIEPNLLEWKIAAISGGVGNEQCVSWKTVDMFCPNEKFLGVVASTLNGYLIYLYKGIGQPILVHMGVERSAPPTQARIDSHNEVIFKRKFAWNLLGSVFTWRRKFLMFSLPRPPEVNDLEDKVQFKGDGMIQAKTWAKSWAKVNEWIQ